MLIDAMRIPRRQKIGAKKSAEWRGLPCPRTPAPFGFRFALARRPRPLGCGMCGQGLSRLVSAFPLTPIEESLALRHWGAGVAILGYRL